MNKWARRLLWTLASLLVLGGPAYYVLVMESHMPADAEFAIDMPRIRWAANQLPGDKPTEVRVEHVATMGFAKAMIVAGDPWEKAKMPVFSYQVVFPDQSVIIDTAMDPSLAMPESLLDSFDDAAYGRMLDAMERASNIVITHEHMDHIGGITLHPRLEGVIPALRLTAEQLSQPDRMAPAKLPPLVLENSPPLRYDDLHPLAPGITLIKAPGHTPGSQMVFVELQDGREFLFLGDVAWQARSIETQRERPRFMTLLIGEDRAAVFGQLKALLALTQAEPALKLVPGHDGALVQKLIFSGDLNPGFVGGGR